MVFKVSKGGVRSGNTLRGLQTKRTKQYSRHACLYGLSSLRRSDMTDFLKISSEENRLVGETLQKTNVLLSLNKQQRWLVPAALNQLISQGSLDNCPMVSLLERHKLKRRSNCVRFTCTGGRLPNVQPKQRKYFSLSLNAADDEQSNREKRKLRAEALKKPKSILIGNRLLKTSDTFTKDGTQTSNGLLNSSRKEYRMEVFYPCPQSCSLTFNPKYTDVVLEEGKIGKLEVKSKVQAQRSVKKKRHRQLFTPNEFDLYDNVIEEDVMEMWDDCYESDTDTKGDQDLEHESKALEQQLHMNQLDALISHAEKAHKVLLRKKSANKKVGNKCEDLGAKRHQIVHIEKEPTEEDSLPVLDQSTQAQYLKEVRELDFITVIMKSSEVNEETLEQKYRASYSEADCQPRRFMINVTDDVADLLSSRRNSFNNHFFLSYLVFIHDGFYDDEHVAFRVIFNSYLCNGIHKLSECITPFSKISTCIDDIINSIVGHLLGLKEKHPQHLCHSAGTKVMGSFLHDRMKLKVKAYMPSTALSESSVSGKDQDANNMGKLDSHLKILSSSFDEDIFCDICYNDVNPTKIDAVHGTKLAECGHHCCDHCWASHFKSKIRGGATVMTCPGYNCKSEIGLATLMSLIDIKDVAVLFQRKAEEEVEISENVKWCPNAACGRAIRLDSDQNDFCHDVICACGAEICFACLGPAHWPAKCIQAKQYNEKLTTLKLPNESIEEFPDKPKSDKPDNFEIEGRICPTCNRFINKNGGCRFMVCVCGRQFCWSCMKPYHIGLCQINHDYLFRYTRLVRVHHIQRQTETSTATTSSKIDNTKQKANLYQRAMQQRFEASTTKPAVVSKKSLFVKNIVSATHKDMSLKKQIIEAMALQRITEDLEELKKLNIRPSVDHLSLSSQEIKNALRHVAEFSFILIKDSPHSLEKQRILCLANDISGICSILTSILDLGDRQDAKTAVQRLLYLQEWAKRALDSLIAATHRLRQK